MDPYRELEIPRGASKDDVKRAYKRKANKTHPDRAGGDKEAFQRVNAAYMVLSDDARRAKYDSTGSVDTGQTDERAAALTMLGGLILHLVDQIEDLSHFDVVEQCRRQLAEQLQRIAQDRAQREHVIRRREAALKRLKVKEGRNFLAGMIEVEIEKMRALLVRSDAERDALKRVIAILDDYEWQVDPQQPPPMGIQHYFFSRGQ